MKPRFNVPGVSGTRVYFPHGEHAGRSGEVTDAGHLVVGDFTRAWVAPQAAPRRRRVDLQQGVIGREQLADDLLSLDDEEPGFFAGFFSRRARRRVSSDFVSGIRVSRAAGSPDGNKYGGSVTAPLRTGNGGHSWFDAHGPPGRNPDVVL